MLFENHDRFDQEDQQLLDEIAARRENIGNVVSLERCPVTQRLDLFFQALSICEARYPGRTEAEHQAGATAVLLSAA